jgi:acyl-CoA thioester hydrolase
MHADAASPFEHRLTVLKSDIDELGHVNNVVYVRWVQEVAAAHWSAVVPEELRNRYLWVVLRHEIDYKRPVRFSDQVAGRTWVGDHYGARFERFVRLAAPDASRIFAEAKTIWCLLEGASMKPLRIPDEILHLL